PLVRTPRHATPRHAARTARAAYAVPAVLLAALVLPLGGLAVAATTATLPAAAATDDAPDLAALAAARSEASERVSRTRTAAAAEPPPAPAVEPAAEPVVEAAPEPAAARPSDGRLTSPFGPRWGRLHAGVDFATGVGAPVRAAVEGTVVTAQAESGYGNTVRVVHADGAETVYAHMSAFDVVAGQPVTAGQDLGREGNTGQSTGPHLHFEVRYDGAPVDPLIWLADRGVGV
ncbi:MAG TPA: M23 family metallopeptidase, partial [Mycobacteriales bacterium]|nr:M23 family metallopeptidase [Mycobacteriales bacterium]